MQLLRFFASTQGRQIRGVVGVIIITFGLLIMKGTGGLILALLGLIPLLASILDYCVFAPLFGASFSGKTIRETK